MNQQRQETEHLLLLDTGDALIGGGILGDMSKGEAVIAGMNLMGYSAMALGPKELSLGLEVLKQRIEEADFPLLSANVQLAGTEELAATPYTILEMGELRIGLIGLTRVPSQPQVGFEVTDPQSAAIRYVPQARQEADTVIVVTNQRYRDALELAETVPGVDLVIAALSVQPPSEAIRSPGTGTLVVCAEMPVERHTGRQVGRLAVALQGDGTLTDEAWESRAMDARLADDPAMTALLDKYR